jgi:hypothetical protein
MRAIRKLIELVPASSHLRGVSPTQFVDRMIWLYQSLVEQILEFYNVLSTVKDGEPGPPGPVMTYDTMSEEDKEDLIGDIIEGMDIDITVATEAQIDSLFA